MPDECEVIERQVRCMQPTTHTMTFNHKATGFCDEHAALARECGLRGKLEAVRA